MATTVDYIEFVCEQIAGVGAVRYRKMFGEYMVYVNDKPYYILDIEDRALTQAVIAVLEPTTPLPKLKKKRADA